MEGILGNKLLLEGLLGGADVDPLGDGPVNDPLRDQLDVDLLGDKLIFDPLGDKLVVDLLGMISMALGDNLDNDPLEGGWDIE